MRDMRIPACNAIKEFYSKIKACPFCGKRTALYVEMDIETGLYSVVCDVEQSINRGCGASGPQCKTIAGAVDAFNELEVAKECENFIEAQLEVQREIMIEHIQGSLTTARATATRSMQSVIISQTSTFRGWCDDYRRCGTPRMVETG